MWHDIHSKFRDDWFMHSEVVRGIHLETHRQQGDLISLYLILQNKESRLRIAKTILKNIKVHFNINILLLNFSHLITIMI
jgi:hypothetical protein